jgi:hypothetical protein
MGPLVAAVQRHYITRHTSTTRTILKEIIVVDAIIKMYKHILRGSEELVIVEAGGTYYHWASDG